jgi:hypothetical protein
MLQTVDVNVIGEVRMKLVKDLKRSAVMDALSKVQVVRA